MIECSNINPHSLSRKLEHRIMKLCGLYKSLRNKVKYSIRKSYHNHWFDMVNQNDSMKRSWSFVKASRSQTENLSFNINDQQCTDPVQIAKGFNDFSSLRSN